MVERQDVPALDFFNIFDDPEQLSVPNPLPRRLAVLVKVDIHVVTRVDLDYVCPSVTDLELKHHRKFGQFSRYQVPDHPYLETVVAIRGVSDRPSERRLLAFILWRAIPRWLVDRCRHVNGVLSSLPLAL